jgi:hypothetical protein
MRMALSHPEDAAMLNPRSYAKVALLAVASDGRAISRISAEGRR